MKGIIVDINSHACIILDQSREDIIHKNIIDLFNNSIMEAEKEKFYEFINDQRKVFGHFQSCIDKDIQDTIFFEMSVNKIIIYEEEHLLIFLREITLHVKQEHIQLRIKRSHLLLSNITDLIINADNVENLLKNTCDEIVLSENYNLAWVGIKDEPIDKTVKPVAFAGEQVDYLNNLQIRWDNSELADEPTGKAFKSNKIFIQHNLSKDPNFKPWAKNAAKSKLLSSIAIPLAINGKVDHVINIYSSKYNVFDVEEVTLLKKIAINLSHGIQSIMLEEHMKKIETSLQLSEEKYRTLFDAAPLGVILIKNIWIWNYSFKEFIRCIRIYRIILFQKIS